MSATISRTGSKSSRTACRSIEPVALASWQPIPRARDRCCLCPRAGAEVPRCKHPLCLCSSLDSMRLSPQARRAIASSARRILLRLPKSFLSLTHGIASPVPSARVQDRIARFQRLSERTTLPNELPREQSTVARPLLLSTVPLPVILDAVGRLPAQKRDRHPCGDTECLTPAFLCCLVWSFRE